MINRWTSAVIIAAFTASLGGAQAQQDFSKVEIKTTRLTDTLYMLEGRAEILASRPAPMACI